MNKIIEKFIDQSTETFTTYFDGRGNVTERYFDKEKYTQLIIEECARIAVSTPCPYIDEEQKRLLGHTWDIACTESARNIRKHFEKNAI